MWRGDDDEEDHHESTRVGSAVGDAIVKTSERTGQEPKCCVGHGCPAAAAVDMVADIAGSRAPSLTLTAARESVDRVSGSDVRWSSLQHPDPLESVGRKVQDLIFYFFWVSCRCVNTRRDPGSSDVSIQDATPALEDATPALEAEWFNSGQKVLPL